MNLEELAAGMAVHGWTATPDPGGAADVWRVVPGGECGPMSVYGTVQLEQLWIDAVRGTRFAEARAAFIAELCLSGDGKMADAARAWLWSTDRMSHDLRVRSAGLAALGVPDEDDAMPSTKWPARMGNHDLRAMARATLAEMEASLLEKSLPVAGDGARRRL